MLLLHYSKFPLRARGLIWCEVTNIFPKNKTIGDIFLKNLLILSQVPHLLHLNNHIKQPQNYNAPRMLSAPKSGKVVFVYL